MKFTVAAVLAAAAGASAHYGGNATVVTEVVESYVTYCPGPTQITHGDKTYTVTEATTLTITNCPCTITKPVLTTSSVVCNNCGGGFTNSTAPASNPPAVPTATPVNPPVGTGFPPTQVPSAPTTVPTAGAGKAAALSGAGLAGVVGLAAFLL
ncbi:Clock-controlled protein 6 [Hirsutella minnesotensis 3608]|uniref:Clock-controlled protein 6 n=1 Tax=Hirsutella minnesotensis 3608 TaxID=1043627 RepID=A0A0F7ZGK9_9HYPO|nr:Clock-controlled protein 6 [Hirsutella minnesotensis 3608]